MELNTTSDIMNISNISTIESANTSIYNSNNQSSFNNELHSLLNDDQAYDDIKCCIENIGKGAFGTVTKGINMSNGKSIIIKTIVIKGVDTSITVPQLQNQNQINTMEDTLIQTANSITIGGTLVRLPSIANSLLISFTEEENTKINNIFREIHIMKKLTHSNIVKYIGNRSNKVSNNYKIMIYMEDVCGKTTDLLFRLPLTASFINMLAVQIFKGLEYIHSQGIIHKDIKSKNIMLSNDGIIKIIDFGASVFVDSDDITHTIAGSPLYMSPELIAGKTINKIDSFKCDIWAGIILIVELYIGMTLKSNYNNYATLSNAVETNSHWVLHECLNALLCKVKKTEYGAINVAIISEIDTHIKPIIIELFTLIGNANYDMLSFIDLLCLCLEPDVLKRYTATDVLGHSFITKEINVYKSEIVKSVITLR